MNRIEYDEILKQMKISKPIFNAKGIYGTIEKMYNYNNILINFDGLNSAIIYGEIPIEMENTLLKKFPNYKFKKSNKEGYFTTYYIDDKRIFGFLLWNMKKNNVNNFNKIMANIDSEIIKKTNFEISNIDWLNKVEKDNENLLESLKYNSSTIFGNDFRKAIDEFDKAVNPFLNSHFKLDEEGNYISKVSLNIFAKFSIRNKENYCCLTIKDLQSKNKVSYTRNSDGFMYNLLYIIEEEKYISVMHYYSNTNIKFGNKGENITICYFGNKMKTKLEMVYNLTNGTVGETFGKKTPINQEQKEFIYTELLNAINLAKTITNHIKKINNKEKIKK